MFMSRVRLITFAKAAMPVDLLADPEVAFTALACYAADLVSMGQKRAAYLKEVSDRDFEKAPPGAKAPRSRAWPKPPAPRLP